MSAISTIDTLAHTNRWSHRHIADKALLAGGLILCALILPAWPAAPLVIVVALVASRSAGVALRDLLDVLRVPVGFIVAGAFATAITLRFSGGLHVGFGDVPAALTLAARSTAGTAAVALFALTVPVSELLARLRQIGLPPIACELAMLMYRMIAVGLRRLRWQRLAQESRLGYVGFRRSVQSAAMLIVATFAGSVRQAERLDIGLGARGFDGTLPVLTNGARHSGTFIMTTCAALAVVVTVSLAVGAPR
jgi:cobalt/nickel transport system permease protein